MEIDPVIEPLLEMWREAEADLSDRLARIIDDPDYWRMRGKTRLLLLQVEQRIAELEGETESWLATKFPDAYALGGQAAATQLGNSFGWTVAHRAAVEQLAGDLFEDFLGRTDMMRRSAKILCRQVAGKFTRLAVTTDRTAVGAAREAARELAGRGLLTVTYRDGSVHSAREWTETAIRTKTAIAYNSGSINTIDQAGVKWVEVFDGPECGWTHHHDPDLALGKIVTVDEFRAFPIAHPNCRRTCGARPDVQDAAGAATAERSVTDAQTADQSASDQANRAQRARATARKRRAEQRARRSG